MLFSRNRCGGFGKCLSGESDDARFPLEACRRSLPGRRAHWASWRVNTAKLYAAQPPAGGKWIQGETAGALLCAPCTLDAAECRLCRHSLACLHDWHSPCSCHGIRS